jgi:acyl carrier protein
MGAIPPNEVCRMPLAGEVLTRADALDWIAEMFEEPKGRLRNDTPRCDIAAWDSLGQLILMSALDQQFGIRLAPAELADLNSVRDILDVLIRRDRLQEQ